MRILYLTNSLDIGGIETNLVRLADELTERGHQVLAGTRGGTLLDDFEDAGGIHVELEVDRTNPLAVYRDVKRLSDLLDEAAPDIVHIFSATMAGLLWMAQGRRSWSGRRESPPTVSSIMGMKNHPDEHPALTQARNLLTTVGAEEVLLISPAIEDHVRRLPVSDSRLRRQAVVGVEMPDVPEDAAAGFREDHSVPEEVPIISTIGRLAPRNSHELFIEAADHLLDRYPEARFFVVGDGPLEEELQDEIDSRGLGEQVHLLGRVDEIYPVLAASDIYVKPGVVEGFVGITVLEAQSLSTPVVAFETEDVKLAIDDGRTGLLAEPRDTRDLADKVQVILEDPKRAEQLGEQGRKLVREEFSMETVVDGLLERYEEHFSATEATRIQRR